MKKEIQGGVNHLGLNLRGEGEQQLPRAWKGQDAMAKKNKRIFTILGAALGTGLAVFGLRRGMQWYQQRQMDNQFVTHFPESSWRTENRYQPIEHLNREPIPATGSLGAAATEATPPVVKPPLSAPPPAPPSVPPSTPPFTGMTSAERVNSDKVSDLDDRGTAFSGSEMSSTRTDAPATDESTVRSRGIYGSAESRGTSGMGTSGGTRDTFTDPGTGMGSRTEQQRGADQFASSRSSEIIMDNYAAPLIEHAIAFNSVMNLLRSRQRDGLGKEGIESLTEGDRASMRAVLDQMQVHQEENDEAAMRQNPLALRSYNLTRKLRDALDNHNYNGSDLYRIRDEVSKELCVLARDLEKSGQVTITGLDHIHQLYECQ